MLEERKRLFFAMRVAAPWPESYPEARLIDESDRHLTLAFLGDVDVVPLQAALLSFPKPPFQFGLAGVFTQPLFLPTRSPRVVAWQVEWWEKEALFQQYYKALLLWLQSLHFSLKEDLLCHVTIGRNPVDVQAWQQSFEKLPCFVKDITLYASLGYSHYETCWSVPLVAPFTALEHTADIAFLIRGDSLESMYVHSWLALSFFEPLLASFFVPANPSSLRHLIELLNGQIANVDAEWGCSIKAVSHHGHLRLSGDILEWEMIADV